MPTTVPGTGTIVLDKSAIVPAFGVCTVQWGKLGGK